MPTTVVPSTSANRLTSPDSTASRGGIPAPGPETGLAGAGRARRSTLPFGVSGSSSSVTNSDGTM